MSHEIAKQAAALAAIKEIRAEEKLGLGTGSTARILIQELGRKIRSGFKIYCTATSKASEEQAKEEGIPLFSLEELYPLDKTIDGADQLTTSLQLIKGGGGALLREKIVAASAKEMLVIADSTKLTETLGSFPLPIEIALFGYPTTALRLEKAGYAGSLRKTREGALYLSDNGNPLYDLRPKEIQNPQELENQLKRIPGVLEVGLFLDLAKRAFLGKEDGSVEILVSKQKS